jgi:hydroxymethylpyrimidine/phosphomethylpyrimidine kinase
MEMEEAARALLSRGVRAALVKGGHLPGDPVDMLVMGTAVEHFQGSRLRGTARGTGCRLASALAAGLSLQHSLRESVLAARGLVRDYLAQAR